MNIRYFLLAGLMGCSYVNSVNARVFTHQVDLSNNLFEGGNSLNLGDVDLYQFTAPCTGELSSFSRSSIDIKGSLETQSGVVIAFNDDVLPFQDLNYSLANRVLSGDRLQLRVEGYDGSSGSLGTYRITIRMTCEAQPQVPQVPQVQQPAPVVQPQSSSGGGSMGGLFLLSLIGLFLKRNFKL